MRDDPRDIGREDELSAAERRAFEALPREVAPPESLEERTVAALRQHGQLPIPIVTARRQDARTPRTNYWIAAAAAVAVFGSGLSVGQYVGFRSATRMVEISSRTSVAEAAAHVRRTGDLYVAALASLGNLRDTTDVQGRDLARKFAVAALGAAAEEVAHIAPDDPLAAAVLRGLNQRNHQQDPSAPSRTVVWY